MCSVSLPPNLTLGKTYEDFLKFCPIIRLRVLSQFGFFCVVLIKFLSIVSIGVLDFLGDLNFYSIVPITVFEFVTI